MTNFADMNDQDLMAEITSLSFEVQEKGRTKSFMNAAYAAAARLGRGGVAKHPDLELFATAVEDLTGDEFNNPVTLAGAIFSALPPRP